MVNRRMVVPAQIPPVALALIFLLTSGCATMAGLVGFGKVSEEKVASVSCLSEDKLLDRWGTSGARQAGRPGCGRGTVR